jgi:two-component sensor histidine kinase
MLTEIRFLFRWLFITVVFLGFFRLPLSAQKNTEPSGDMGPILYEKLHKTQKEYEQAMRTGDSLEVAEMCYRLGKRYLALGQYITAQHFLVRSLRIREPLGPSEDIGKVYIFLSSNLTEQKKYSEAIQYIHKALTNFKAVGNQQRIMGAYINIASLYYHSFELHQYNSGKHPERLLDSAFRYIHRAEEIALSLGLRRELGNVYASFGALLLPTDVKSSLKYLKKAQLIFIEEKYTYAIIGNYLHFADVYLKLRQPNAAGKWLNAARYVRDTSGFGDHIQQRDLLQLYARFFEQKGRWKEALAYYKKSQELLITSLSVDRQGAVTRIETEYETQKKELQLIAQKKELALRNQNLQTQRRLTRMTMGIGLLAVITSIVFYWFFQKYRRLSRHNAALVSEQNHRVKNNLQQITNLLSLQSSRLTDEEAKKAVTEALLRIEAMALVHQRLYDGDRLVEINLSSFIPELVEGVLRSYNYSHLHPEYRLDPIWLHVDSAIPMGLIINELVTNSCKYAFPFSPEPVIKIRCWLKKNQIYLELTDNGPSFDFSQKPKTFGLKLLQIFSTQLKAESGFENRGTTFRLLFSK